MEKNKLISIIEATYLKDTYFDLDMNSIFAMSNYVIENKLYGIVVLPKHILYMRDKAQHLLLELVADNRKIITVIGWNTPISRRENWQDYEFIKGNMDIVDEIDINLGKINSVEDYLCAIDTLDELVRLIRSLNDKVVIKLIVEVGINHYEIIGSTISVIKSGLIKVDIIKTNTGKLEFDEFNRQMSLQYLDKTYCVPLKLSAKISTYNDLIPYRSLLENGRIKRIGASKYRELVSSIKENYNLKG